MTIDNPEGLRPVLTTKGDIFVCDGTPEIIREGIGTDAHVLTADSTKASGLKWAAAAGGGGGDAEVLRFYVGQLDYPNNSDWAVNALAAPVADSNNAGLTVARFDDTTEEGVGFEISVPTGKTNIKLSLKSRAETGPGGVVAVVPKFYNRGVPNNLAVESWTSGTLLTALSFPVTTEFFQYDSQTFTLASLGITAGELTQFQLTRVGTDGGDTLVGDWTLIEILVEFT